MGRPFDAVTLQLGSEIATATLDGSYALEDLPTGSYTLTPVLSDYSFWPPSRTLELASNRGGVSFTILPAPVSMTISPTSTGSLSLLDTQGLLTTLSIPSGAVSQTTELKLTPQVGASDRGFAFAGHAFELAASQRSQPLNSFAAPLQLIIHYSDADVRVVSQEAELVVRWWTANGWRDASESCPQPGGYERDLAGNRLSIAICSAGRLVLFGPTNQTYLPAILQAGP